MDQDVLGRNVHPLMKPMLLYCDKKLAITVAKNNQYHA